MFLSYPKRLRAWLELVDDMLVGDDPPADAHLEAPAWATHPHRRPLHAQHVRRAGSVPPGPAHCLCLVRPVQTVAGKRPSMRDCNRVLTN
jgi:hypothetical protein